MLESLNGGVVFEICNRGVVQGSGRSRPAQKVGEGGLVFPKIVNFFFWLLFWCEWLRSQKNLALRKSHVLFALRIIRETMVSTRIRNGAVEFGA